MAMTNVGVYLKTLRDEHGLTLDDVANAAGVTDRAVAAWEKGKNTPSIENIRGALGILKGAWEDIVDLLKAGKTAQDARDLAKWRAKNPVVLTDDERALLDSLSPEQRRALFEHIRTMRDKPE